MINPSVQALLAVAVLLAGCTGRIEPAVEETELGSEPDSTGGEAGDAGISGAADPTGATDPTDATDSADAADTQDPSVADTTTDTTTTGVAADWEPLDFTEDDVGSLLLTFLPDTRLYSSRAPTDWYPSGEFDEDFVPHVAQVLDALAGKYPLDVRVLEVIHYESHPMFPGPNPVCDFRTLVESAAANLDGWSVNGFTTIGREGPTAECASSYQEIDEYAYFDHSYCRSLPLLFSDPLNLQTELRASTQAITLAYSWRAPTLHPGPGSSCAHEGRVRFTPEEAAFLFQGGRGDTLHPNALYYVVPGRSGVEDPADLDCDLMPLGDGEFSGPNLEEVQLWLDAYGDAGGRFGNLRCGLSTLQPGIIEGIRQTPLRITVDAPGTIAAVSVDGEVLGPEQWSTDDTALSLKGLADGFDYRSSSIEVVWE